MFRGPLCWEIWEGNMEEDVLELSLAPQLGFKQRQGDGIPGGRKGLSKCGEVGEHRIRDQGLSPSLCIHSQYHLGPRLPAIILSIISKPNHDQKQKRFLFLCILELPHKGLELLTHWERRPI